jgi:hypothetical protein
MEQTAFLSKNVFNDLSNHNAGLDDAASHYFTETDFATVLERVSHYGIGVYHLETYLDGKPFETMTHETSNKKITDSKWYKRAYLTLKSKQTGLLYTATYKVSSKLLAR